MRIIFTCTLFVASSMTEFGQSETLFRIQVIFIHSQKTKCLVQSQSGCVGAQHLPGFGRDAGHATLLGLKLIEFEKHCKVEEQVR